MSAAKGQGRGRAVPAVALGCRAFRGGCVVVAVRADAAAPVARPPAVLLSTILRTAAEGDRIAFEPYHVAVAMPRGDDGQPTEAMRAAVAEGRARQRVAAIAGLEGILHALAGEHARPAVAALLVNRAGWMTDLLAYSLEFADHPPVAEGLAVRDAMREAFAAVGLACMEADEKSLPARAAAILGVTEAALWPQLKALARVDGKAEGQVWKPWRKEQQLAALAAWVALVEGR